MIKHSRVDQEIYRLDNWTNEERGELVTRLLAEDYDAEKVARARASLVSPEGFSEIVEKSLEEFGKVVGLGSGYWEIDKMTAGFAPGELTVVSGQTSQGKTLTCLNMMARQLMAGHKCVFITLEMTKREVLSRLWLIMGKDGYQRMVKEDLLRLQEEVRLPYAGVRYAIENAKEWGAEIVYIDHLHYFAREMRDPANGLGIVTQEFKATAIEQDIPVVLIAHTRKLENGRNRPKIDDLRGSSYIGQDADVVLMVWQPKDEKGQLLKNEIFIGLEKNRNRSLWQVDSYVNYTRDGLRIRQYPYSKEIDNKWSV